MGWFDETIGGPVRNLIWRLPGGRQAFPEGRNGTIWWWRDGGLRDHASGRTVLGAAATGGVGGLLGGGNPRDFTGGSDGNYRPQTATRPIPAPWMSGSGASGGASGRGGVGRQGSVVANGFVGAQPRPSEIGPPRPRPSSSLPQAPNPITRNDPEVDPRVGDPFVGDVVGPGGRSGPTLGNSGYAARPGRGGTVSRQHNLGAGALGSAGDAFTSDHLASLQNRRGLLAEY